MMVVVCYLLQVLIGMLDPDAPLEEVGQRILTAFKQAEDVRF